MSVGRVLRLPSQGLCESFCLLVSEPATSGSACDKSKEPLLLSLPPWAPLHSVPYSSPWCACLFLSCAGHNPHLQQQQHKS